jgi:hypothetical protein
MIPINTTKNKIYYKSEPLVTTNIITINKYFKLKKTDNHHV